MLRLNASVLKKNAIFCQFHDSGFIKMVWKNCIVALEQFPLVRQEAELSELGKSETASSYL